MYMVKNSTNIEKTNSKKSFQVDMGVAHGDELQYIFSGLWGDDIQMSSSDRKFTKNIFIPLLTNFAKTRSGH
jgi:hypothetical protein